MQAIKNLIKPTQALLTPGKIGDLTLRNRIVTCALTRQRCAREGPEKGVPNDMHVEYYSKRGEDAGLVLTECSSVAEDTCCYPGAAGVYNQR